MYQQGRTKLSKDYHHCYIHTTLAATIKKSKFCPHIYIWYFLKRIFMMVCKNTIFRTTPLNFFDQHIVMQRKYIFGINSHSWMNSCHPIHICMLLFYKKYLHILALKVFFIYSLRLAVHQLFFEICEGKNAWDFLSHYQLDIMNKTTFRARTCKYFHLRDIKKKNTDLDTMNLPP